MAQAPGAAEAPAAAPAGARSASSLGEPEAPRVVGRGLTGVVLHPSPGAGPPAPAVPLVKRRDSARARGGASSAGTRVPSAPSPRSGREPAGNTAGRNRSPRDAADASRRFAGAGFVLKCAPAAESLHALRVANHVRAAWPRLARGQRPAFPRLGSGVHEVAHDGAELAAAVRALAQESAPADYLLLPAARARDLSRAPLANFAKPERDGGAGDAVPGQVGTFVAHGGRQWDAHFAREGAAGGAVVGCARRLVEAVLLLHALGVAHGDLGAHNVLVGADGRPRLIDWELASVHDPAEPGRGLWRQIPRGLVRTMHLLGTGRLFGGWASQVAADWRATAEMLRRTWPHPSAPAPVTRAAELLRAGTDAAALAAARALAAPNDVPER